MKTLSHNTWKFVGAFLAVALIVSMVFYTPVQAATAEVIVSAWGGGGGGGSRSTANGSACGGGGGGFSQSTLELGVDTFAVDVGAGGPGGTTGAQVAGTAGSDSTFDTNVVVAKGGDPGNAVTGGRANCEDTANGGQASSGTGDTKYSGGTNGGAFTVNWGGNGGGGAGTTGNGGNGCVSPSCGGAIVASPGAGTSLGGGSGGAGKEGGSAAGNPGGTYGGGGGGGRRASGTSPVMAGGDGAAGAVEVRYLTASGITATGGSITTDGSYTVHTFTSDGTFEITSIPGGTDDGAIMMMSFGLGLIPVFPQRRRMRV